MALAVLAPFPPGSVADIVYGPWTFPDDAFADTATQIEAGGLQLGCAVDVTDALTGFSPDRQLYNIGYFSHANLFELEFLDRHAINGRGPDIIFFESRFSSDPYEIAVRPQGGRFTSFIAFAWIWPYRSVIRRSSSPCTG